MESAIKRRWSYTHRHGKGNTIRFQNLDQHCLGIISVVKFVCRQQIFLNGQESMDPLFWARHIFKVNKRNTNMKENIKKMRGDLLLIMMHHNVMRSLKRYIDMTMNVEEEIIINENYVQRQAEGQIM